VEARPASGRQTVHSDGRFALRCVPLEHRVDTLGWRLDEPDGRRMLPDRLAAFGVVGPDIGRLQALGALDVDGRTVRVEEVSDRRPGQSVAVVTDTAWCDGALELADSVDLLVCEATF